VVVVNGAVTIKARAGQGEQLQVAAFAVISRNPLGETGAFVRLKNGIVEQSAIAAKPTGDTNSIRLAEVNFLLFAIFQRNIFCLNDRYLSRWVAGNQFP